ncbi:iron chelate uptake ABC transporter family permease subunit, partial [Streptomyces drozdowiczii]|uniref:iron chelate uptake ABC transporter family permease subunit n=1 Tax=Streptomyces drozdowiczii TaxID=202862 RepID=UPI0031EDBC20
ASGAGLAATLRIALLPGDPGLTVPLAAFVGALGGVALAYLLGNAAGQGASHSATLMLAGIAVSSFLGAMQTFVLQYRSEELQRIYAWVLGGVGAAGLALCLTALRRGWRVPASRLVGAGLLVAAAFAFLPPVGSTDHLNYAAYGRMAATGHDPYATRASDLPHDPVINAVQE